jgi:hypothetical protein
MPNLWALIPDSPGNTSSGAPLTVAALQLIAQACEIQLNRDYSVECGAQDAVVRVVTDSSQVNVAGGEKPYYFVASLPNDPTASAYHIPGAAYCAVSTCQDPFGPNGVGVDASHEILEDAGNPGCNMSVDDGAGSEHERERCDAVETQAYPITVVNEQTGATLGTVYVSNFLLDSWAIPGAKGPYTFMTKHGLAGGIDPAGPFQTARSPSGSGNYQLVFPSDTAKMTQIFAAAATRPFGAVVNSAQFLKGTPRKINRAFHWSSRIQRCIQARTRATLAAIASDPEGSKNQALSAELAKHFASLAVSRSK